MVENLRKEAPLFVVDGGDLFSDSPVPQPEAVERGRAVAALMARGTELAGIDAMVPGRADLALGWDLVQDLMGKHHLPYLASNLSCEGDSPLPTFLKVEREGVTLGFVGAVSKQATIPGCQVVDPVQVTAAAVTALGKVDAVVALGDWDAQSSKALVEAAPAVSFIISSGAVSLSEPRQIADGSFQLGNGPQGKKVGVLKAYLEPGGQGWRAANGGTELKERMERYTQRLADAQDRVAKAEGDEKAQAQARRQVSFYQGELEKVKAELASVEAAPTRPMHRFTNSLTELGTDLADHAAVKAMVDEVKPTLPPEPKPVRPAAPSGAQGGPGVLLKPEGVLEPGSKAKPGARPVPTTH